MQPLKETFIRACAVSVPLIAINTVDPTETLNELKEACEDSPIVRWDCATGFAAVNDEGRDAILKVLGDQDPSVATNPSVAINLALGFPKNTKFFILNAHRFLNEPGFAGTSFTQAIWNLRDEYKERFCTAILLGPSFTLPVELQQDVFLLDEPLPDRVRLGAKLAELHDAVELKQPSVDVATRAVDALRGLSTFNAEQVIALSLKKDGVDVEGLWERKRRLINATEGLSVWQGGEKFDDLGGLGQQKKFLRRVLPLVNGVVFIDEIEKALAGSSGPIADTSGVSQAILGKVLTFMQDRNVLGEILLGPPGAGKSAIAKSAGNEAGIPTISLDLSGIKASLVGETEQRLTNALKVIDAVTDGRALFIATCNGLSSLPPELRRRFNLGIWFSDLPSKEERDAIWSVYTKQFGIDPVQLGTVKDEGWTGAEIRTCALLASQLAIPLAEASEYIVPVSVAASESIDALRSFAHGRFLDCSNPGVYRKPSISTERTDKKRALSLN